MQVRRHAFYVLWHTYSEAFWCDDIPGDFAGSRLIEVLYRPNHLASIRGACRCLRFIEIDLRRVPL